MISLRTYVYIDALQPQLAEYIATVSQGFLPIPGDACLWTEVSPGMAVHRLTDIALKATRVHLAQQVVERAYGSMVIHQRDQSDVVEAGSIWLSNADITGRTGNSRIKTFMERVNLALRNRGTPVLAVLAVCCAYASPSNMPDRRARQTRIQSTH